MPEDLYKICYSRYFLILLEDVISTSFSQRKHLAEYFHAYITSSVLLYSCTLHIPVRENEIVRCSQTYIHAYIVHAHSTVHAWSQTFLAPWCMHAFYMGNALCMQYVCELSHTQREREKCCSSAVNAFCTPRKLQTVEATPPIYWNHLHELEAQILLLITV